MAKLQRCDRKGCHVTMRHGWPGFGKKARDLYCSLTCLTGATKWSR